MITYGELLFSTLFSIKIGLIFRNNALCKHPKQILIEIPRSQNFANQTKKTSGQANMKISGVPTLSLAIFVLQLLLRHTKGDVYLHSPRGSNNRLNGEGANRRNAHRLFDSQVRLIYNLHSIWHNL